MNNEDDRPGGIRDRLDRANKWRADLTEEAIALPQTMADLRKVITDLKRVSQRLERATEGIEIILNRAESSGIAPLARQIDAATSDMERQIRDLQAQLPGGKIVNQAMDELQRTFDAFTGLVSKPRAPKPRASKPRQPPKSAPSED